MAKHARQIIISAVGLVSMVTVAAASELTINGYYKNFSIVYDAPRIDGSADVSPEPIRGLVTNRIRVNASYDLNDRLSISAAYNIVPRIQDPSSSVTQSNTEESGFPAYRFADFETCLYPRRREDMRSFGIFQNLDRALLTVSVPVADLYLGRQAIAWGSARAVNPTDILAPYTFDELDTEDRRGVDAARLRIPLGFMGEIDAGYVFGDGFAFDQSAFFLRGKYNVAKTDISGLLIGFRENLMVGLDLARPIGGAGFWLEGAYTFVDALERNHCGCAEEYFRGTVGIDYVFFGNVYCFAEYHFSQAGTGDPGRYGDLHSEPAYTDGAVYLLGRHYFIPGFSLQITPLLTGSGQVLVNIGDPSFLVAPGLEYNIREDIYLSAGAFIGLGQHPTSESSGDTESFVKFRSEFGGYSDMYYTSFRVYF